MNPAKATEEPQIVYRIIDRSTGQAEGVYSRAYHDVFDFNSPGDARHSNCCDIYKNTKKYAIAKYRVTYELIDGDCDK